MTEADIRIFQIHYKAEQAASLDPAFTPFNNAGQGDPLFEFSVFKRLNGTAPTQGATHWGAFSWKFGKKTQMTGADLLQTISDQPGHDVYYCNYSPDLEALFQNLWLHGELRHPGLLDLAQELLTKAGLDPAICQRVETTANFATANFFVATPAFWRSYIAFVDRVLQPALSDPALSARILSPKADPRALHVSATYLPFLIERLFGVFLETPEAREFSAFKYPILANEALLSPHHLRLREMKQAAWKTRSKWMMQCWYGYRNLVLEIQNGSEWAASHLPIITPVQITFSDLRPH